MKHRTAIHAGRNRKSANWSGCSLCGRNGLHHAAESSPSTFAFHYALCGRPCAGGVTLHLIEEDTPKGIHKGMDCAECKGMA